MAIVSKAAYQAQLGQFNLRFPETNRRDGDHPWLTPVRSIADDLALSRLLQQRIVDEEFVADVLAIDFEHPLFSSTRCQLLRLVPEGAGRGPWVTEFVVRLRKVGTPAALELATSIEDPAKNVAFHRQRIQAATAKKIAALSQSMGLNAAFRELLARREALARSEISQNPRGQILEPGFRVIFPR